MIGPTTLSVSQVFFYLRLKMAKRKALSKKLRFEVFKRDSFKCQYCGRGAPEVLLHVDHIKPVKDGGENDMLNLVTSCQDCNLGKGARRINDKTVLEKQRHELEELQQRREQLEMMMQWRDELEEIKDQAGNYAIEKYEKLFNCTLSAYGEEILKKEVAQFGLTNVLEAMDITSLRSNIPPNDRMRYMAGICWNKIKESK